MRESAVETSGVASVPMFLHIKARPMEYTKQYFIDKFTAIHDSQIGVGALTYPNGEPCCALGHCGMSDFDWPTEEALALNVLFAEGRPHQYEGGTTTIWSHVYRVNDNDQGVLSTPKSRIISKLQTL